MQNELKNLARELLELCSQKNISLAVAESCTGGMVASAIVSIAGASACFRGSAVCYCDESKESILGVSKNTIRDFDAESEQCAIEMARGASRIFKASAAVSTTGFVDSNVGEKSIGKACKVFVGIVFAEKSFSFFADLSVYSDRDSRRTGATLFALSKLLEIIKQ